MVSYKASHAICWSQISFLLQSVVSTEKSCKVLKYLANIQEILEFVTMIKEAVKPVCRLIEMYSKGQTNLGPINPSCQNKTGLHIVIASSIVLSIHRIM
jgi:hypothetical protein